MIPGPWNENPSSKNSISIENVFEHYPETKKFIFQLAKAEDNFQYLNMDFEKFNHQFLMSQIQIQSNTSDIQNVAVIAIINIPKQSIKEESSQHLNLFQVKKKEKGLNLKERQDAFQQCVQDILLMIKQNEVAFCNILSFQFKTVEVEEVKQKNQ